MVLGDSVPAMDWMMRDDGACCEQIGPALYERALVGDGAGIAIRKEDQDLKEMFNKALAEMLADGTYKSLNDQYFDFDVYGSD